MIRGWWSPAALLGLSAVLAATGCGGGGAGGADGNGSTAGVAPTFAKSYGGPARDWANTAQPLPGGGYAFVGTTGSRRGVGRRGGFEDHPLASDLWLTVVDELGDVRWQRSYGRQSLAAAGADHIVYRTVRSAIDVEGDGRRNGVWLAGRRGEFSTTFTRGTDLVVTRLDATDQPIFTRIYDSGSFPDPRPFAHADEGSSEAAEAVDIWPTADGGALVAAHVIATVDPDSPVRLGALYVLKIDASGAVVWSSLFRPDPDKAFESPAGRLYVRDIGAGAVLAYGFEDGMQVTRIDAGATNPRWQRTYSSDRRPSDLLVADEDGDGAVDAIVVAGTDFTTSLLDQVYWGFVIKLGSDGEERWGKAIGTGTFGVSRSCPMGGPCGYLVAAFSERYPEDDLALLRRLAQDDGATLADLVFPAGHQGVLWARDLPGESRVQAMTVPHWHTEPGAGDRLQLVELDALTLAPLITTPVELTRYDDNAPDVGGAVLATNDWNSGRRLDVSLVQRNGSKTLLTRLEGADDAAEGGFSVVPLADGGFVIAGESLVRTSGFDQGIPWLMRLDATGAIVWQHRLVGFGAANVVYRDLLRKTDLLRTTAAGGVVLASTGLGAALVKVGLDGAVDWSAGGLAPTGYTINAIRTRSDGSVTIAGDDASGRYYGDRFTANTRAWAAALDATGVLQWHRRYDATVIAPEGPRVVPLGITDLRATADGGAVLAGYASTYPGDAAVAIRLDGSGAVRWSFMYPLGQSEVADNVRIADAGDGGFVLALSMRSPDEPPLRRGGFNVWLVRIDADGQPDWAQGYGGAEDEFARSIELLPDGGFLVAAQSDSVGDQTEAWLLRVGADGRVVHGCQADRGRIAVVARTLLVVPVEYALPAGAGAAVGITPEATNIEPREPPGQVVARQCFGAAASTSGPRLPSRMLTVRPIGAAPGVVTSTPSGIVCGTAAGASCAAAFPESSLVTLRVDLGSVSRFTSWGAGCESVSGAFREVCLVRLETDTIIDAMFGSAPPSPPPPPVGEWRLTVTVDRIGAFVGSTDGSFACTASGAFPINTCAVGYPPGRVLDLYAERLPGTGVLFESWQGDCASFGAQSRIRITMDRHWNCRAAFVSGPP